MLRFLHTSDWHLGRQLYGRSLIEDQVYQLERLIELIDDRKPHALLISGDLFDRPLPPEAAVSALDHFLQETAGKRELPIFIIPGNHDSCERVGFASSLLRDRGVHIFSKVQDAFAPIAVCGESGHKALVHGIPFVEPIEIARLLGQNELTTPDVAIAALCQAMLEKAEPQGLPHILLCHAFVAGAQTCESEKEIFIGGSSVVQSSAFDGFTYTALGHLHRPQSAGNERVRYSGSLLPYSKSEAGHEKTILEINVDCLNRSETDGHSTTVTNHHLKSLRRLRAMEGELDKLIANGNLDPHRDDYVVATYTDRGAILDAFSKLHMVYPNLLHVARSESYMPNEAPSLSRQRRSESVSELDLFAEFFRSACGEDLTENERQTLIDCLAEFERQEKDAASAGGLT